MMLEDLSSASTKKPPLNAGQQAAAEGFFESLFDPTVKEMTISGGGGVGKTFLMGHMIDEVMPQYFKTCQMMGIEPEFDGIEMMATTNKAAEVLSQATARDAKTMASFLNLKVKDDYTTGKSTLIRTSNWHPHHRKILFCDECSMIDPPIDREMLDATINCKVVFVGDHCQLAPVGYKQSSIYDRTMPFFNLTEPMRNANQPALMAICEQLRHTVETGVFYPIETVNGVIDHLNDEEMEEGLEWAFKEQNRESRIINYTNQRVVAYNEHIRQMRGLPDEYGVGEILVNSQAIQFGKKGSIAVEAEVEIMDVAPKTDMLVIEDQHQCVQLEIRYATLKIGAGRIMEGIPLAVDRDHHAKLLKYYASRKNWNRLFYIKNHVPDLRPRDAATTYKVQGSTYENVFIDMANLSLCNKPDEVARALYVAFSRPRSRVFMYGELAQKYGGIVS